MKIDRGDVVKLRSGGPEMSVLFVSGEEANCVWFDQTFVVYGPENIVRLLWGTCHKQLFEIAALEVVKKAS